MSKMDYSSSSKMGKVNFTNLGCFHPFESINPYIYFSRGRMRNSK